MSLRIPWPAIDVKSATKLLIAMLVSWTGDGILYYLYLHHCVLVSINKVHMCLLSCHRSKHSIPKVITGHYVIRVFG